MGSVWVLFLSLPIQDPYILHTLQAAHIQPVSRLDAASIQLPAYHSHIIYVCTYIYIYMCIYAYTSLYMHAQPYVRRNYAIIAYKERI